MKHGVEIRSQPQVSTIDQQGVVFPITVNNTLPAGSDPGRQRRPARLEFTSDNAERLTIKPIELPRIPAQDSFTDDAEVTARANGIVPVTAQLVTPSGRKVGPTVRHRGAGDPERDHRLADRPRRGTGPVRHHGAPHPDRGPGEGPGGRGGSRSSSPPRR